MTWRVAIVLGLVLTSCASGPDRVVAGALTDSVAGALADSAVAADSPATEELFEDALPEVEEEVHLNPADVDGEFLDSLPEVLVVYQSPELNPDVSICSRSSAGWNACILGQEPRLSAGIEIDGLPRPNSAGLR